MDSKRIRGKGGRFVPKASIRQVRSFRASDEVWEKLRSLADEQGLTPADYLEQAILGGSWQGSPPNEAHSNRNTMDEAIKVVLSDTTVTRQGKDKGACARALTAMAKILS